MNFKQFSDAVNQQLNVLCSTGKLFKSSISGGELWNLYLSSFREGDDLVFRDPNSTEHTCNLDNAFFRRYGNIVAIDENYDIISLWDVVVPETSKYYAPAKALSAAIKSKKIEDVFFETFAELNAMNYEKCKKTNSVYRLGIESNHKIYNQEEAEKYGVVKAGEVRQFNHFYGDLNSAFVDVTGSSQASILGGYRDSKNVFQRGMQEISLDTLHLVKDLINQGSLLDGTTHLYKIEAFIPLKEEYELASKKDEWCWVNSYKLAYAKFRNELIGTLCVELSEGVELNKACETWNKRVDPANYMKVKAPITAKQIAEAQKFVEENGYVESFNRRFATLDDINVNEIAHSNVGNGTIKTASLFDSVKPSVSTRHKRSQFDGIEEVSIDKFMKDILPSCTSVEVFVENRMTGNFVTLTTSVADSKPMFKWNNLFSWTFNGNLAGKSQIKEAVKTSGGKVDGVLRFSIMWGEDDPSDNSDLDAWCQQPSGERIGYSNKLDYTSKGNLDVDITQPNDRKNKNIVENITFPQLNKMRNGQYLFWVNPFSIRGANKGFKAEIEFNGEVFQYEYTKRVDANVTVAIVTLSNGVFTIEHKLPETNSSKKIWNIETNQFHKVNLVCLSPNHWGENNVGNKHYLFMLDNCHTDIPIRSFHNENLNADLLTQKRTLEVYAGNSMLQPTGKDLSGIGFNSTISEELIVKLSGNFKRSIKIKF